LNPQHVEARLRQPSVNIVRDLPDTAAEELAAGTAALARGSWHEARTRFEAALSAGESPEGLEGLGTAAWWLIDEPTVFRARERAYQLFRERHDDAGAARVALMLAWNHLEFRGAPAVSNGWLQLARRHVTALGLVPELAMLRLFEAHVALLDECDVEAARKAAAEASAIAGEMGVVDLEMLASAMTGLALVTEGRVKEGMALLDEAAAAASSGVMTDPDAIGSTCCYLIYACERVRDHERAAQWCRWLEEFSERWGHRPLVGICRAHYAWVLMYQGRWADAEANLDEASTQLERELPPLAVEAVVRLGELRRRQGRHHDAEQLFAAVAGHPIADVGLAALACDSGEHSLALERAERYLRHVPQSARTERVAALEVSVRSRLANGRADEARSAVEELQRIAHEVGTTPLRATAAAAEGFLILHQGDAAQARVVLERAAVLYDRCGLPYEAAIALSHVAGALGNAGETAAAERVAREASNRLAKLRSIGVTSALVGARPPDQQGDPSPAPNLSPRELDVLRMIAEGLTDREMAAQLGLSDHTVHRHASNLLAKLGVSSRAAAVAAAGRFGLI
jgi:LuxR family maltose regulon positive regulatory protein